LALSSVTTVPARAAGIGHRIGMIAKGYDAGMPTPPLPWNIS
jgi:imidazolonepropionase-like amidohydrolase